MRKLWTKSYIFDIGANILIYIVYFLLMLWSTSYVIDRFGASIGIAGLASGIFVVGALVARIPTRYFIDYVGRRAALLWGTALYFALTVLYPLEPDVETFIVLRFAHGMAFGAATAAASTVAGALIPLKAMGAGFNYYTVGVTAASAIGPFMGMGFVNAGAYDAAVNVCIGLTAVVFALSLFIHVEERTGKAEGSARPVRTLGMSSFFARRSLAIAFLALLGGICFGSVLSFLGEYTESLGLSAVGGAYFFFCFALTAFLSRPLTGYLLERGGGDIVIYPALMLLVSSMIVIALAGNDVLLLFGALLLGAGYGSLTAACHTLSLHCALGSEAAVAASTYFAMLNIGIGASPFLLGLLVPLYGFATMYLAAGAIAFFGIHFYYMELGKKGRFSPARMEEEKLKKLRDRIHAKYGAHV